MFLMPYKKPLSMLLVSAMLLPVILLASPMAVYASEGGKRGGITGFVQNLADAVMTVVNSIVPPIGQLLVAGATIFEGVGLFDKFISVFRKDEVLSLEEAYPNEVARQNAMIQMAIEQNIERLDVQDYGSAYILRTPGQPDRLVVREDLEAIGYLPQRTSNPTTASNATSGSREYVPRSGAVYKAVITDVFPRNLVEGALVHNDVKYYYDVVEVMGNQQRTIDRGRLGSTPIPWDRIEREGLYGNNVIIPMNLQFELPTGVITETTDLMFAFVGHIDTAIAAAGQNGNTTQAPINNQRYKDYGVVGNGNLYDRLPGPDLLGTNPTGGLIGNDTRERFRTTSEPHRRLSALSTELAGINSQISETQTLVAQMFYNVLQQANDETIRVCLTSLSDKGGTQIANVSAGVFERIRSVFDAEYRAERARLRAWHGEMGSDCNAFFLYREALRRNPALEQAERELEGLYDARQVMVEEYYRLQAEVGSGNN